MTAILEAQGLRKVYRGGDGNPIEVLSGIDLTVGRGEFVAIMGASGSGKSTLLHLLGALDSPSGGTVRLAGQAYDSETGEGLSAIRNRKVGFVFQFHHLLREFTALENVMMPLLIAGEEDARARSRAEELLAAVGLAGRMSHRPSQLSGGEQQRAAVARALAADPLVVLADEPSGNLDHANSEKLHELFAHLSREFETALVVVTHNRQLAARADRVLSLEGGHLVPLSNVEWMP
ncbi:MAG TPA: ABC transporter ATP-binding protein [Gemmatimonadales bacterium]|nr:ABC transporter ATP-binding protein [Gemmatimonadales bacterium]